MPEAALNHAHRPNRTAIAVVVLMHGAAITALGLSKMEVIRSGPIVTKIFDIPNPPPPETPPPPPIEKVQLPPRHVPEIYVPTPPFPAPTAQPRVDASPRPIPETPPYTPPGPVTIEPSSPPLPPEPKKIESARARANLSSYVSDSDYPAAALRAEEQGTARFRLNVGADGRVESCTITGSSGSSALDAATCRIMKSRARFTPARNSDGQPTGDTVANAIRWVLPD